METVRNKLILFDIDGILIRGRNESHRKSFSIAIKKLFNVDVNVDEIKPSGKTDTRIVIEMSNKRGIPQEIVKAHLKEIFTIMVSYVKEHVAESNLEVVPHIEELLEELKQRGHILGLLTGNLEEIAKLKLKKVGLLEFFQVGGFGEISETREKLAENAIEQVETKFGTKVDKKNVFYIGDAPLDIECGRNVGIKTIAVATGPHPKEELTKLKPDFLFDDFSDFKHIIEVIENY